MVKMKHLVITEATHQKLDLVRAGSLELKSFEDVILWLLEIMEEKYT